MSATEQPNALTPGLYFVATPLGNARDITLRTLDILGAADVLAAEDTRSLRHLMEIHGVPLKGRRIVAYHDHNGAAQRPKLLGFLAEGKSLAYASEAGTPLVADPGYALGRDAIAAGHPVYSAPGPSAVIAALTVSGLPTDRFLFAGFPPNAVGARRRFLEELAPIEATLVLYESPNRLLQTLTDCAKVLGGDRSAAVCRELTKKFEEVSRGSLNSLVEAFSDRKVRGEIAICIGKGSNKVDEATLEQSLIEAMKSMKLKDAANAVAARFGVPKRDLYQLGLEIQKRD
ncbi:16S rRNA (cytidine(1402)-2'-O)-methyltransferase [Silicimonas sp. MF1-12-2]|uniref:16S rRNA (cytidine(1402)-2'-O)-methyltransferase n=1 Tax=Silicimonas sp. MF1-12-2 TaxID=3384793 RepID=UPI0039B4740C